MSDGGRQNRFSYAARCAVLVAAALAFPIVGHAKGRVITPTNTVNAYTAAVEQSCNPLSTTAACNAFEVGYSMATNAGTANLPAGSVVVIGAPTTSYSGFSEGVAFVFVEPSGGWSSTLPQPTILLTGSPVNGAGFGTSVAISSDGNTIVVGAPGDNGGNGAAWVFTNPDGSATSNIWAPGTVSQSHELTASTGSSVDQFGDSVAISPSGNTIVVGAPDRQDAVLNKNTGITTNYSNAGAAYVFTASSIASTPPSWNSTAVSPQLLPPNASISTGENFGTSVAISGDAIASNSVTSTAIFVGAPGGGASGSGVVDVFEGATWSTASEISDPANASPDQFGASVAIAGTTAVVGAPGTTGAAGVQSAGAAYVFTESSNGSWTTAAPATLTASGATNGNLLGTSVAISGDGSVVVVGAPGNPPASATGSSTMYQFDEPAKGPNLLGWSSENESDTFAISRSSQGTQDDFGASAAVAISGRNTWVFAGAPYTSVAISSTTTVTDAGEAYIFQGK